MATYTKTTSQNSYTNGDSGSFGGQTIVGGDLIEYESGTHTNRLYFKEFVGASKENPILIDVKGNDVDALLDPNNIRLTDCEHVKIINGTFRNSDNEGILSERSANIALDNVDVIDCGSSAIRLGVQTTENLPQYWRSVFKENYVDIRNCNVVNADNEGVYISNSLLQKYYQTSEGVPYAKSFIDQVIIKNCTTQNTGLDGIQVGATNGFCEISHCEASGFAAKGINAHSSGFQMGEGTTGIFHHNYAHSPAIKLGSMLSAQGQGIIAFNNLAVDTENGINFVQQITEKNRHSIAANNTFIKLSQQGFYNSLQHQKHISYINNIIHLDQETAPDDSNTWYNRFESGGHAISGVDNIHTYGAQALLDLFEDAANDDYTLKVGSAAIGNGLNLSKYPYSEILKNYAGVLRLITGAWDTGAY